MTFSPRTQKTFLTAHVVVSVGWIGAVAAFLALSIAGETSGDFETVRSAYLMMDLIGWSVIVPLSFAALATGIIQALGTHWGLIRYYWVLVKLVLTLGATFLLLLHQFTAVAEAARRASVAQLPMQFEVGAFGPQLIGDSAIAMVTLLVVTTLSVFKPWGRIPFGKREQHQHEARAILTGTIVRGPEPSPDSIQRDDVAIACDPEPAAGGIPKGLKIFLVMTLLVVGCMAALHHLGRHAMGHGH